MAMGEGIRMLGEAATAGWPLGIALAAVIARDRVRERRRRTSLNRALHELRRPLQALALAPTRSPRAPDAVDLALAALGDLDHEINRAPRPLARRPVACRALVESAVERWRGPAASSRRSLELRWRAGAVHVMADPVRIGQALDNLLANALEHGGLRVLIDASVGAGGARIAVIDGGSRPWCGDPRDPRRGHGLRIVAAIAEDHGGRFTIEHAAKGTAATLELPLAPVALPAHLVNGARAAA
jgi:signal transduction histidine kinase